MGTPSSSGNFDIQNFFKNLSQPGNNPPFQYTNTTFHEPPLSSSPCSGLYPSSANSFFNASGMHTLPSHGFLHHSFSHPPQDQEPQPPSYPSQNFGRYDFPVSVPSSPHSLSHSESSGLPLPHKASLKVRGPPSDGACVMKFVTPSTSGSAVSRSLNLPQEASETFDLGSEFSHPPDVAVASASSPHLKTLALTSGSGRLVASNKLPKGRQLKGEHLVYDVDVHLPGEEQPELEFSPITVYSSDPVFDLGRQIAVNKSYICFALRLNQHIRILNMKTASKRLLRGHSQRVTDMLFFAEDVDLLASASSDGMVVVRRIEECPKEGKKSEITEQILLAIQITGDWDGADVQINLHFQMQNLLVVAVNRFIISVDIAKVRIKSAPNGFTLEDPMMCSVYNPIEGVHCVNGHDDEITDLSTSQSMRLASASRDGTIRIWQGQTMSLVSRLTPHEGRPVSAVAFLPAPHGSDHLVLLSGGPLNQELKLWVPVFGEGSFSQSGLMEWKCIQRLDVKSSALRNPEDAFFNQVFSVPRANVILLANAKRNALYVVHVNFDSHPSVPQIDYLAEFSVKMPILSITALSDNVLDGHGVVEVYCVQMQSIHKYYLDLSQCRPPVQNAKESCFVHHVPKVSDIDTAAYVKTSTSTFEVSSILSPKAFCSVWQSDQSPQSNKDVLFGKGETLSSSPSELPRTSIESSVIPELRAGASSTIAGMKEAERDVPARDFASGIFQLLLPKSQVDLAPLSPRGQLLRAAKGSTDDVMPTLVSSPRREADAFCRQVQSGERKHESVPLSLLDVDLQEPFSLSPRRRVFQENLRMNEDWELQVTSTSVKASVNKLEQQVASSPMRLITPSELMSMVARTRAEADGGLAAQLPLSVGMSEVLCKVDPKPEGSVKTSSLEVADDSAIHTESITENKACISSVPSADFTEKAQVSTVSEHCSPTTCVGGELDAMEEAPSQQLLEEGIHQCDKNSFAKKDPSLTGAIGEAVEQIKEADNVGDSSPSPIIPQVRKKKNKNKTDAAGINASRTTTVLTSAFAQRPTTLASTSFHASEGVSNKGNTSAYQSSAVLAAEVITMQESLNQLLAIQKELQKQMTMAVAITVAKEVMQLETGLGQRMENMLKAHMDALWARIQEDSTNHEKLEQEQVQQLATLFSNCLNRDLPANLERAVKKELSSLGHSVAHLISPSIEKSIVLAANDAFQKGIDEKGLAQLEKSVAAKIEATLSRQLQAQFQSTGKQALQETLRFCLEGSVIPAVEQACQLMFGRVDAAFQKSVSSQQKMAASHSSLASTLQDMVTLAASLAVSLKGELADGLKRLALAETTGGAFGTRSISGVIPEKAMTVQHVEESLDPTKELSRLISEGKIEEAFKKGLLQADIGVLSWLCNQVDPASVMRATPIPLSQGVLLALMQQLGSDLGQDTDRKLSWIKEAALAINPCDAHTRFYLAELYQNLHRHISMPNLSVANELLLVMHLVNSLLTACNHSNMQL